MRKLLTLAGCGLALAVMAFVVLPAAMVGFPGLAEQYIALTCRQPSEACRIRMRAMGHVWAGKSDLERARQWYALAAEQGDAASMFHLAWVYEQYALDDMKSEAALVAAARNARMEQPYLSGPNGPLAAEWYRRSAAEGFAPAMNNLGELYSGGLGGEQDLDEAFAWHLAAARAGNPVGAMNVAIAYRSGQGVFGDPEQAEAWSTWKPANGLTPDLTEPTLGRTHLFGATLPADRRALIRAAAEAGEPVKLALHPLRPDARLPTFSAQ